jgi:hypothetical protein
MTETYSVWYFSNADLGNIQERECRGVDFETACKWFMHHTTNVTAKVGLTARVIVVDDGDMIVCEWKHGLGIVWPIHNDEWFGGWHENHSDN